MEWVGTSSHDVAYLKENVATWPFEWLQNKISEKNSRIAGLKRVYLMRLLSLRYYWLLMAFHEKALFYDHLPHTPLLPIPQAHLVQPLCIAPGVHGDLAPCSYYRFVVNQLPPGIV